jgi:formate/nitrite transporter
MPPEVAVKEIQAASGDALTPYELTAAVIEAAERKAALGVAPMVVRGILSAAFLGAATLLAATVWAQGLPRVAGALAFPVGFCIMALLGLELATGNFALLPAGWYAGRVTGGQLLRNWWWVYLGNLMGGVGFAVLAVAALTGWWDHDAGPVGEQLRQLALAKTVAYADLGWRGWLTALTKGILANWLVTVGAVLGFASRSTVGKIVAIWLPIFTFFGLGYEHSVVNMFVMPAGMLAGAPITLDTWWQWNQVPATLGNIIGGAFPTGLALAWSYGRKE